MQEMLMGLIEGITKVLPLSPFRDFLDDFAGIEYLGWLNWFVPIDGILTVLTAWLGVYGAYLLYSIIMRWVKVIGD